MYIHKVMQVSLSVAVKTGILKECIHIDYDKSAVTAEAVSVCR